jgi:LPS-assembly protein
MRWLTQALRCAAPAPRAGGRLCACALAGGLALTTARAQVAPDLASTVEPLKLRLSPQLQEAVPAEAGASFLSGQWISGRPDLETSVQGQGVLRKNGLVIKADRLDYNQATDTARAQGQVLLNRAGNVYQGPELELRVDAFEGFFTQPSYQFLRQGGHGQAQRIDFLDASRSVVHNASFTTCTRMPGADWMPEWILRADHIQMDQEGNEGVASGALLSFKGLPILPVPYLSFPLTDQRKSGLLPPTFGVDNLGGVQWVQPYYWNIAPNRDATFTPTIMTKRGVDLGLDFRYLESQYGGSTKLHWMPSDALRGDSRWAWSLNHQAQLPTDWAPGLNLSLNLNRVSDDNYWRDFSGAGTSLTQRLLTNDAVLSWGSPAWGGNFSNTFRTLKWQTLQDPTAPITPPYDRLPQLATRFSHTDWRGLDLTLDADYTRFESDPLMTGQPNGERVYSALQLSRPLFFPGGHITPRMQLHASSYQFDAPLANGARTYERVVPTVSLDSGLVFERDTQLLGRNLTQTLEPRAFYVYTPFRDQSLLPNYDSGAIDFNMAALYTENAFVGNDRISDSDALTLGVTTRYLLPDTGAELARFGMAQRLRFKNQNVTMPGGTPATDHISDLMLGGSVAWTPTWGTDATVQYSPSAGRSVRSVLSARYRPGSYRSLSAAYRYQQGVSEQLDLGWQWPLNARSGDAGQHMGPGMGLGAGRWYSVGRLNFDMQNRNLVDSVLGLEYDGGCWLGRVVFERLQTSTSSATQRLMFQLEFVGFTRVGVNPLSSLRDNVPNYQMLRDFQEPPSRFSHYD